MSATSSTSSKNKVAIITGGLSGIGLGLVKYYLRENYHIVVFDRVALNELVTQCDQATNQLMRGLQVSYYQVNMANNKQVQQAVKQVVTDLGRPNLVINCAGILRAGRFVDLSADDFTASYQVNVLGSRHLAAACLPVMQSGDHFAFIASMAGTVGIYGYSAYGSSKFAVLGMAQCIRAEYAPTGIHISVICPPEIATPMVADEIKTMYPATRVLKDFAGRLTLQQALKGITQGLAKHQFMIVPGSKAKCTLWLNRLTPVWIQNWVIDMVVRWHKS